METMPIIFFFSCLTINWNIVIVENYYGDWLPLSLLGMPKDNYV